MADWAAFISAINMGEPEMPEFSGRDHEAFDVFVRECADIFYIYRFELHLS